jgi:hypothetical protein
VNDDGRDDESPTAVLKSTLAEPGRVVFDAHGVDQALSWAGERELSATLVDWRLTDQSGDGIRAREKREREEYRGEIQAPHHPVGHRSRTDQSNSRIVVGMRDDEDSALNRLPQCEGPLLGG